MIKRMRCLNEVCLSNYYPQMFIKCENNVINLLRIKDFFKLSEVTKRMQNRCLNKDDLNKQRVSRKVFKTIKKLTLRSLL